MPEDSFNKFIQIFSSALEQHGGVKSYALDGVVGTLPELWQKLDRTELVRELAKRAAENGLPIKRWAPLVQQIDFMTRAERDLRIRYRNRAMSISASAGTSMALSSIKTLINELTSIESS